MGSTNTEDMNTAKQTAFVIPVIDGELHLGQRVKSPHAGHFAAIGGKSEAEKTPPYTLATIRGRPVLQVWDYLVFNCPKRVRLPEGEAAIQTAARETAEEIMSGRADAKVLDLYHLGYLYEYGEHSEYWLHFYLGRIETPLNVKRDELAAVEPLRNIPLDSIAPATREAINYLDGVLRETSHSLPEIYRQLHIPTQQTANNSGNFVGSIRSQMFLEDFVAVR